MEFSVDRRGIDLPHLNILTGIKVINDVCQKLKGTLEKNDEICSRVLCLLQLLSCKSRFHIICLLLRGEFSVNEIVQVVSEGQCSNVSQQLKALTLAGMTEGRRVKRQVFYRLKDERVRALMYFLQKEFLPEESRQELMAAGQSEKNSSGGSRSSSEKVIRHAPTLAKPGRKRPVEIAIS